MELIKILVDSILSQNIALVFILGMCPLIAISNNLKNAFWMGIAVVFVVTLTAAINYPIYQLLLKTNTTNLALLIFIITIAATVQFLEMFLEKFFPTLYNAFGIFLPLITVNCVVLAISLFFVNRNYNFGETVVYSFGSGLGWMLAIILLAGLRERLKERNDIPRGLKGKGIAFIILGILALAFIGFTGLI
ncbi:MAG: Rnf-Nqr domain containing protein [Acholeplasmatales bacterium]|jgi:Na+-transporting NADH:ubiquinone oxidoreductase subunit E|nr:NADH:ubiquinone reductase (Na(+)-transporting) subunit E [Acholeplasmataceae bacterium]MDY0115612.1 Rnf-Nqr domain containing protein [Acholeplasmatales bacterium]MCK9233607.1 NADH:ubiquinone reductase (Na(+)-transporting) subunit E [Acholeplasmataceae bacterium]MCK9289456.1 NADH:ubiquinone reductase (Na(+)-transporting) subunit E [Acholeplasmataceae bacterium]MCK9427930.1 NADH:ubiquinone reductase (Na(+)-transporting) subunit E [Acholeplasmataceae bacterium]